MQDYLERMLPPDWIVVTNCELPTPSGSVEIDAIVIGDRAVWVVDEKGLWGTISGDEHRWYLDGGQVRERPLDTILRRARTTKGYIEDRCGAEFRDIWVQALIILSSPDADVSKLKDARASVLIRQLAGCENYFKNVNLPQARLLDTLRRAKITEALSGRTPSLSRSSLTQLGAFELLEKLASWSHSSGVVLAFRARHKVMGSQAEVRLFDLSGISRPDRESAPRWIEREPNALLKLRHVPGVVRLIENVKEVSGFDGDLRYFATDLPEDPALGDRITDLNWTLEMRLNAAERIATIIAAVHSEAIVHRNLTPATIYFFGSDIDFIVSSFRLAQLPSALGTTVPISAEHPDAGPYTAPELAFSIHDAGKATDVYALGVILFEILAGYCPFKGVRTADEPLPPLKLFGGTTIGDLRVNDLHAIIELMTAYEPLERPQQLDEVIELLREMATVAPSPPLMIEVEHFSHPIPSNAQLDRFRIVRSLPSGGCFHVYLVTEEKDDAKRYVAKIVRSPNLLDIAWRDFKALSRLVDHRNIVRPLEIRGLAGAPYQLLEEFVPGNTLHEEMTKGPVPVARVALWAKQLLDALAFMESGQPPIYHGDLSPRNIIISHDDAEGEKPVLVDFGLSWVGAEGRGGDGVVGTAPYRPPERDVPGAVWPANGDSYSLGVILCQALYGELPYESDGMTFNKRNIRSYLFQSPTACSSEFAAVLNRSVEASANARFSTAREMLTALLSTPEFCLAPSAPPLSRNTNPWVSDLIKLFSQGRSNSENRGFDSKFAELTYVPTELDEILLPDILAHKYALVVLTGNPGDGKTAFLQRVARLLGLSGTLPLNHWEITDQSGWIFECVLDGSASDTQRGLSSSKGVLDALLKPLLEAEAPVDLAASIRRTQLLAINDGRLLDYLNDKSDAVGSDVLQGLASCLEDGDVELHRDLKVINLNARSLVNVRDDTFDRVLDALLGIPFSSDAWGPCVSCRAAERCHVRYNSTTLLDSSLGPIVRERLRALLLLVHGRGRLHITMRELRSSLAFALFGDQSCDEIHLDLETTGEPESAPDDITSAPLATILAKRISKLYFSRIFSSGDRGARLLNELGQFDPGKSDEPRVDRLIRTSVKRRRGIEELMKQTEQRRPNADLETFAETFLEPETIGVGRQVRDRANVSAESYAAVRRRLYFEGGQDLNRVEGDEVPWLRLTPYRHAADWLAALRIRDSGGTLGSEWTRRLCRGISLSDNADSTLLDRFLAVRTVQAVHNELLVLRLYDLEGFSLKWVLPVGSDTIRNSLPSSLSLEYVAESELFLEITADLFEVLMRLADGYHVGAGELDAVAAHLQIFKNRLLAHTTDTVRLVHPTIGSYDVKAQLSNGVRSLSLEGTS